MTVAKNEAFEPTGLEKLRDNVADTMDSTARTIADQLHTDDTGDTAAVDWRLKTAEWLDQWSDELREWDARETDASLRAFISARSGRMLLFAGVVGVVMSGLLRKR